MINNDSVKTVPRISNMNYPDCSIETELTIYRLRGNSLAWLTGCSPAVQQWLSRD